MKQLVVARGFAKTAEPSEDLVGIGLGFRV